MKKIFSLVLCGLLMLSITGCGNNDSISDRNDNSSSNNDNMQENVNNESNNQQSNETYDKIIHCDIPTGTAGTRADEAKGSYFEYYIKDNKIVKYERFRVLTSEYANRIDEYITHLKNNGWKQIDKVGNNIKITVEYPQDAPEDNNPLNIQIDEVEQYPSNYTYCYIK